MTLNKASRMTLQLYPHEPMPTISNLSNIDQIKTFTSSLLQNDKYIFNSQHTQLSQSIASMQLIISKILNFKMQTHPITTALTTQISEVQLLIKQHKTQQYVVKQQAYQNQIRLKHDDYVHDWQQRIILAKSIDMDKFKHVHIEDRKSKANQVFKLILLVFYSEPIAKYYWPNFKRQAFINDGGEDLKERLGRMKPALLREEQKAQIKHFLSSFSSIYISRELSKVSEEIQKIRDIVKLYMKGYELSLQIKVLNQRIQLQKEKRIKGEQNIQKWTFRHQALNGRLTIVQEYISSLDMVCQKLHSKITEYKGYQLSAQTNIQRLEQAKALVSSSQKLNNDGFDPCQCIIM